MSSFPVKLVEKIEYERENYKLCERLDSIFTQIFVPTQKKYRSFIYVIGYVDVFIDFRNYMDRIRNHGSIARHCFELVQQDKFDYGLVEYIVAIFKENVIRKTKNEIQDSINTDIIKSGFSKKSEENSKGLYLLDPEVGW